MVITEVLTIILTGSVLIGLYQRSNGDRIWVEDATVGKFLDFAAGEPNKPNVDRCVAMYRQNGFKWIDLNCGNSNYKTLCEFSIVV